MSALAAVAGKSFNGKFAAKFDFPIGIFYVTSDDADIGSLKSIHTLFDKYFDHMLVKFEQDCMVQTIPNFELFDKNGFWQSVDAILEDVSVTETNVWFSVPKIEVVRHV